jgi:hypothetical protein
MYYKQAIPPFHGGTRLNPISRQVVLTSITAKAASVQIIEMFEPARQLFNVEVIMRRHENRSTMMTSNRPIEEWGKLLSDVPAASAILDRLLQHARSSPSMAVATGSNPKSAPPSADNLYICSVLTYADWR